MSLRVEVTPKTVTNNALIPLLMTRPRVQSQNFVDTLPQNLKSKLEPVLSPLIEIAPLDVSVLVAPDDMVIFTSVNGVACAPLGQGQTAYCVGVSTTRAALERGWAAQQVGGTSSELVTHLRQIAPKGRIWHLAGIHTRGEIAQKLGAAGLSVTHVPLYDQALPGLTSEANTCLRRETPVIVPLFSPRTAKQFAFHAQRPTSLLVAAISSAVAEEVSHINAIRQEISSSPDAEGMRTAIEKLVQFLEMG